MRSTALLMASARGEQATVGVAGLLRSRRGQPSDGCAKVLELQDEILDEALVLDVRVVLDRPAGASLLAGHEGPVLRGAREAHVVGDDDGAGVQPLPLEHALPGPA